MEKRYRGRVVTDFVSGSHHTAHRFATVRNPVRENGCYAGSYHVDWCGIAVQIVDKRLEVALCSAYPMILLRETIAPVYFPGSSFSPCVLPTRRARS